MANQDHQQSRESFSPKEMIWAQNEEKKGKKKQHLQKEVISSSMQKKKSKWQWTLQANKEITATIGYYFLAVTMDKFHKE